MLTTTTTSLREKMRYYLDLVSKSYQTIIIPRSHNVESVVIMPLSEYNSLKETNYLLSTEANRNRLKESIEQVVKGELIEKNIE